MKYTIRRILWKIKFRIRRRIYRIKMYFVRKAFKKIIKIGGYYGI